MQNHNSFRRRSWFAKFRDAFRGVKKGVVGQNSFAVHFFIATLVIAAAGALQISNPVEWCVLLMCITIVLTAEMFNSALESLAPAITDQKHPNIRSALDVGSAAVLFAAVGSVVIGAIVFGNRLGMLLEWW